jgi:hypothetical protein
LLAALRHSKNGGLLQGWIVSLYVLENGNTASTSFVTCPRRSGSAISEASDGFIIGNLQLGFFRKRHATGASTGLNYPSKSRCLSKNKAILASGEDSKNRRFALSFSYAGIRGIYGSQGLI